MANTFKNYTSSSIGTTGVEVYRVPLNVTSILIGCNLANTSTSQITVSLQAAGVYVVKDAPIPAGSSLSVLDGKVILEEDNTVVVTSSAGLSTDALLSVLEQT